MNKIKKISYVIITILVFLGLFFFWFNRIPERNIPMDPHSIVSPANGKVIAIIHNKTDILEFLKKGVRNSVSIPEIKAPYQAIVIEMNILNIHAQRSPIEGKVIGKYYIPGKFENAVFSKNKEHLAKENEKIIHVIENDKIRLTVIQVAGILARRIQSFVEVGDTLKKGEIFGRILLGSQVVLVLPETAQISTKIGDILIDGESVVAKVK